MKRTFYILSIIVLSFVFLSGCGEKVSNPPDPVPDISVLLEEAWAAFSSGDYETAVAIFDSVIEIDASITEAYIGKGWSSLHTGNFATALGLFSLAISAEGKSPTVPVSDETNAVDTTWSESLWVSPNDVDSLALITPHFHPIMGMLDTIVTWNLAYMKIDTTVIPPETTYTTLNFSTPVVEFTVHYFITKVPTDSTPDSISITYSYSYLDTTTATTDFQKDAYAGETGIHKANNDENNAIISASTVIYVDPTYSFSHDNSVTATNLHILLARSYYNAKLFYNAVNEVLFLDPSWTYDPFSPQFLYELAKKIEELEG